ncbi:PaaI family thioesterase [Agromyces silvae]|uniref:PaaI family thioesterase n=1 Tax=Agromyces silvae TaxID=3388266 RepID=UPI00280BC880|nr:PaaI family thioesterase [Agromyces protaetiae]
MSADGAATPLSVLDYLQRQVSGRLRPEDSTWLRYPTPVSGLLGIRVIDAGERSATLSMDVTPAVHGNQQGTVHGGTIAELADAAIGTAHSTVIGEGESFATIELTVRFLRPVWQTTLTAVASAASAGRTISHYRCEIRDDDDRPVAVADSSIITLRGDAADRSGPRARS